MVTYLGIELRLRKLSGRLTVARILLILGWIAVMAGLPMGMGTVGGFHPKTYTTWATITSPFFLLFTPIFLGLAAGTAAGLIASRVKRSWPIWLCRVATIGLLCESLPLYAADVVSLVIYLRQPVPKVPVTEGLGGFFLTSAVCSSACHLGSSPAGGGKHLKPPTVPHQMVEALRHDAHASAGEEVNGDVYLFMSYLIRLWIVFECGSRDMHCRS